MPTSVPMTDERMKLTVLSFKSFHERPRFDTVPSLRETPRTTSSTVTSTCDTAKSPTSTGTSASPLKRLGLSKVLRMSPVTGSMPMVARKRPSMAEMSPLTTLPEAREATTVRPKTATAKYSTAPKDMAARASSGATEMSASALSVPPTKDATVAMSSARRDSPRAVRAGPSSMVAAADTVPGVPTRMAVMQPP